MNPRIILACTLALALSGCKLTTDEPKIETAVVIKEQVLPPMSNLCHADAHAKFKTVAKGGETETPVENLGHALQSNKSRMAMNRIRVQLCECSQAQASRNPADIERLKVQCDSDKLKELERLVAEADKKPTKAAESGKPS